MSSRSSFWLTALLLAGLVLLRAFPFVWWPGTHFDSDQAVVGLMAKHISEARAFPLFYYGQDYMLAVEAYLAAPVMLVAGPTVTALKSPLVVINVAIVILLLRILVRDARLHPMVAAIAVLPIALPAAGVAARVTEANGGNVEPWLYVLLLWIARDRPWWLGGHPGVRHAAPRVRDLRRARAADHGHAERPHLRRGRDSGGHGRQTMGGGSHRVPGRARRRQCAPTVRQQPGTRHQRRRSGAARHRGGHNRRTSVLRARGVADASGPVVHRPPAAADRRRAGVPP